MILGKTLVDIILSNNGYKVVDLGIKVTPAQLIEAIRAEKPDFVGLSGLLVKSAQQMVLTAQDFKAAGIDIPILVGGAALHETFYRDENFCRIRWTCHLFKRCHARFRTGQSFNGSN